MDTKKSTGSASTTKSGLKSGRGRKGKKEEEEKRLEEEARLRQEQEEKERQEREIQLEEERKNREIKVVEIKSRELNTFYDIISEIKLKLENFHKIRKEKFKWERYMRCDGSPDPTIPGEINTFLTLWKEDDTSEDFRNSLDNINLAFRLIDELNFLIEEISESEESKNLIEKYQKTIHDLEEVTKFKIDQASHAVLMNASDDVDPETLNFSFSNGDTNIFFCIWANLSHNKRITSFSFADQNFSFQLPRPLTLAHFNLRCLFTKYDFYTTRSKTFPCRVKPEKFDFDPVPEIKIEEKKENEEKEDENENLEDADDLPPELKLLMEKTDSSTHENEEEKREEQVEQMPKIEEEKPVEESKDTISSEELAILQELSDSFVIDLRNYLPSGPILHIGLYDIPPQPKKIKHLVLTQKDPNETLVPFIYPTSDPSLAKSSWQEYWAKKQELENQSASNQTEQNELGDTIGSKKLDLNSTAKSNDLLESTLGGPDETMSTDKNFVKGLGSKSNEQLVKSIKNESPLEITYRLPSSVFFAEAPMLARWDEEKTHWRTDEILDFKYNDDQKEISFKTYHFTPYCLLQDRHVHMPFQLWRMAPREAMNSCMFTIETSYFELNIEIKFDQLRIYVPIRPPTEEDTTKEQIKSKQSLNKQTKPEKPTRLDYENQNPNPILMKVIEPIANKWFKLREFKALLISLGLNIFPEPDSEKFVTITNKNKKLEWISYRNMALCSCLISMAYSKWNGDVDAEDTIIMLYQEHTKDKEPKQDLYKCLISTTDVFYVSESTENSDDLDQTKAQGTEEHSNMYHLCLEDICKNDKELVYNRVNEIDPLYFETCLNFLESLKVLTFS